jgi:hypothetical protein
VTPASRSDAGRARGGGTPRARRVGVVSAHWQGTPLIAKLVGTPGVPLPVKPASL